MNVELLHMYCRMWCTFSSLVWFMLCFIIISIPDYYLQRSCSRKLKR